MDTLYAALPAAPAEGESDSPANAVIASSQASSTKHTSEASAADLPPVLQRACLFEVEVVLTPSGTKITPSLAQYGVCLPQCAS